MNERYIKRLIRSVVKVKVLTQCCVTRNRNVASIIWLCISHWTDSCSQLVRSNHIPWLTWNRNCTKYLTRWLVMNCNRGMLGCLDVVNRERLHTFVSRSRVIRIIKWPISRNGLSQTCIGYAIWSNDRVSVPRRGQRSIWNGRKRQLIWRLTSDCFQSTVYAVLISNNRRRLCIWRVSHLENLLTWVGNANRKVSFIKLTDLH